MHPRALHLGSYYPQTLLLSDQFCWTISRCARDIEIISTTLVATPSSLQWVTFMGYGHRVQDRNQVMLINRIGIKIEPVLETSLW